MVDFPLVLLVYQRVTKTKSEATMASLTHWGVLFQRLFGRSWIQPVVARNADDAGLLGNQGPEALKQLWHVNFQFNKSHNGPSFESYFSWSYHEWFAAGIPPSAFSKVRLCSSTDLLEKFHVGKTHAASLPFGRWQAAAWRVSLDPDGNGHISFGPLSFSYSMPRRGCGTWAFWDNLSISINRDWSLLMNIRTWTIHAVDIQNPAPVGRYTSLSQILWHCDMFFVYPIVKTTAVSVFFGIV